jgi:LuxR family glucitol operon transcriptional activator
MSETGNAKAEENIPFHAVLGLVDTAVFTTTGKHLSNIEVIVLQCSWQGQRYPQIASENGYALEYLKNDIGPQLWKRLSQAFGEKISKTNLRAALQQRIYQNEQEIKRAKEVALAQQDRAASHAVLIQSNPVAWDQATNPHSKEGLMGANDSQISSTNLRIETLEQGSREIGSYPPIDPSLGSIFQPKTQKLTAKRLKLSQRFYHNLPPRDYTTLVGRESEIQKLLEWLSFEHPTPRISIEGIGGVGKTALLLDVAYRCWQTSQETQPGEISRNALPRFEAIIFTSAKSQNFTTCGIFPRFRRERTLRDIFTSIVRTLKCGHTPSASFEEACEQIYKCLGKVKTLLIVDNLDTLENQQDVLGFLYELPSTVKVVITSRELTPFTSLRLTALSQTEALNLIQHQAQGKGVQLSLGESQKLYQTTGGVPAAIVYAVSQLAAGYTLPDVSPCLVQPVSNFSRFYFESAVQPLQGQAAHRLLMAIALFPKPPVREAICAVAAITDSNTMAEGLARLQQLSLIQQQQGQYTMLPLTRGYVLSELSTHPEFEHNARNRWVDWYLSLARSHGGKDWTEWNDYQPLEREWENIIEVMEWCISSDAESGSLHDRYPNACQLWRDVKCYTYSQGYRQSRLTHWETSLVWLDWLIEAAQTRKDWATAAEMMGDRAWKLTLMGQSHHLAAAGTLFTQAWELRHHQTVKEQVELAIHTAAWHIQQQDFESAKQWLDRAKALLDNAQLDPSLAARYSLNILYYQGEISYKTGDYEESQTLFQQIVDKAQAIGWQRATFLAKDFLADIAIKQGNLDQAQQFLTEGLRVAQENGDRCSGAYAKRSLAQLERKRGRLSIAHRWATEARKEFESLGMLPEAQETQVLLQG